jgi:hypothetical protein
MSLERTWRERSSERLPDGLWNETIARVRGEFREMPGMRVTPRQAESLLGLRAPIADWVLEKLEIDGFLSRTAQGEYVRRHTAP